MKFENGALAPLGSACLKKVTTLFFVSHPKCVKPLLGPFLTAAGTECGQQVIRSPDATVTSSHAEVDHITWWQANKNGDVVRTLAGGVSHG